MPNQGSYHGIPASSEAAEEAVRQSPHEQTGGLLLSSSLKDPGQALGLPVLRTQFSDINDHTPATLVNELPGPSPSRNHCQCVSRQCAEPVVGNGTIPIYAGSPAPSRTPDQFRAHGPYFRQSPRRRWTVEEGGGNAEISGAWSTPVVFLSVPHAPLPAGRNSGTPLSEGDEGSLDQAQQSVTTSGQRPDEPYCGRGTPAPTEEEDHIQTTWYLYSAVFLIFQMGLPVYYFHRVAAIFEDTEFTIEQMKHLVCEDRYSTLLARNHCASACSHSAYYHLTSNWADFIDSILREWKTLNLVSVLLLTAIVATLQIDAAFEDPVVYFVALYSLVSSLLSLIFGCLYILRFNTMRAPHKAIKWAQETQSKGLTLKSLVWNVWLMLALPAIWLVWSLLFYIICIIVFVWRVRTSSPPGDLHQIVTAAARVGISLFLAAGLTYFVLAVRLFVKFSENNSFRAYFKTWMILKRKSAASSWVVIESSNSMLPKGGTSHQARQDTIESSSASQPSHGQGAPHIPQPNPNPNAGETLSSNPRGQPSSHVQNRPREFMHPEQSDSQAMNSPIPSIDLELDNLNLPVVC